MKYIVRRDKFRVQKFIELERKRLLLRSVFRSRLINLAIKRRVAFKLDEKIRFRERCVETGRGRSVQMFFHLSRGRIRELARDGRLLGIRKGTW
jgi:ribosomal protein S14